MLKKFTVILSIILIVVFTLSYSFYKYKIQRSNNKININYNTYANNYDMEYKVINGPLYGKGKNNLGLFGKEKYGFYNDWVIIVETNNIIHIDVMNGTIIYLTDNGDVYGLGNSEGIFDTNEELILIPKLLFEDCKFVSLGIKSALFLKKDNTLWFVGESKNGQSTYIKNNFFSPIQIAKDVVFAKAFGYTNVWLDENKSLYLCGDNSYGQIGNGSKGSGFPTLYKDIVSEPYLAIENCCGFSIINEQTIEAVTEDGKTYIWGGEYGNTPSLRK